MFLQYAFARTTPLSTSIGLKALSEFILPHIIYTYMVIDGFRAVTICVLADL
jgi:hypothetical protein